MTTKNDGLISSIEESLSKNPQTKEVTQRARNLFDDAYGSFSHAGSQINNYLDNLPKSGEMSPTAKALKTEFEKNCKSLEQGGKAIGNDFRTYGVPMLRDRVMKIQKDPVLFGASVATIGCSFVAATTPNAWLRGAAICGIVTGGSIVVAKSIVNDMEQQKPQR